MSSASILELSKQLLQLDSQAKYLRSEVEYLRSTKRSLEVSDVTQGKLSEMRESTDSIAKSRSQRSRASTQRSAATCDVKISLPQDFIDDLTHKCGDVDASIRSHKELVREKEALQALLAKAEDSTEAAEQEYISTAEVAGMDSDGTSRSAAGLQKKSEYNKALMDTAAVYRQRENARIQLEGQSRELLRLATILQETTDAEGQRAEAAEVLAERKAKLAALRHECDMVARATARRDKIAEKTRLGLTEEDYVRHSNFDRRVALHELSKEDNLIKENNLAIRYRAMQITKIQMHLELVGGAIIGDVMEGKERVDAEIVDELVKEINGLYDSYLLATLRMDTVDCGIEKMVWRASALQQAKDYTVVEMGRFRQEHRRYLNELQNILDKEHSANAKFITRLQNQMDALYRKSARKEKPMSEANREAAPKACL
ncbi:conserved hypothetical protein [Leishmania braziliensis MHOM/BR/75/M2904]|uniref:Uncharacterized protein n=2 Tax=Leishmania braziliensis TaxID=5660 RepID=A4HFP7_LEIBR|nr:conserved hypothetical protein [Leishmania braziliensis MHOM/BR/75/M2904]KAI5684674.1 hypothetical protein MNV84_04979 [Leishmania braziliensis]CAJ2475262.1 unnamed protein product [Leishmania braziliensis]CAJ2475764.1 unnamed protein product [Leishmania braziliensis]CAM45409.2 conserved hypothetical protein [Leishmania braziliensis MHOM/BR/75/M2904]SYZ67049.1 hypothetical_protein [Leishmania braziliensis MHOM/BR/75/M2904]